MVRREVKGLSLVVVVVVDFVKKPIGKILCLCRSLLAYLLIRQDSYRSCSYQKSFFDYLWQWLGLKNSALKYLFIINRICMYRGCPLWNCPWDRAFQLDLGDGPINKVSPMSQACGAIDTASRTVIHTHV